MEWKTLRRKEKTMKEDEIKTEVSKERREGLQSYLRQYQKNVEGKGSGVVVGFGKDLPEDALKMHILPLDIPSLDKNLGGGIPLGGIFTVAGVPNVGKTTFGLRVAAAAQRAGKITAWIDAEHTFDAEWAKIQGVDVGGLLVVQAETLEDTLNMAVDTFNQGLIDFAVLDSMDATIARQSMESKRGKKRDLDDDDVALKARQFSRFFPRILHRLRTNRAGLMLVAQYRTSGIGSAFVNAFNISGGRARGFYDWMTLEMRKGPKSQWIQENDQYTGFPVRFIVSKSKVPGVREGLEFETTFFYDQGFSIEYEKVKFAYDAGLISRTSQQSHVYVDTKGKEHKIPFGKEEKAIGYIIEAGLTNDVWTKATGSESKS